MVINVIIFKNGCVHYRELPEGYIDESDLHHSRTLHRVPIL